MMKKLGICLLVLFITNIILGGLATEYVVEFWGSYFKNAVVDVPFFPCAVAGFFFGEFTVPAAVLTWVLSFVVL